MRTDGRAALAAAACAAAAWGAGGSPRAGLAWSAPGAEPEGSHRFQGNLCRAAHGGRTRLGVLVGVRATCVFPVPGEEAGEAPGALVLRSSLDFESLHAEDRAFVLVAPDEARGSRLHDAAALPGEGPVTVCGFYRYDDPLGRPLMGYGALSPLGDCLGVRFAGGEPLPASRHPDLLLLEGGRPPLPP